MRLDHPRELGGLHPGGPAHEQGGAHLALKRAHRAAQGLARHEEPLARTPERPLVERPAERLKRMDVHETPPALTAARRHIRRPPRTQKGPPPHAVGTGPAVSPQPIIAHARGRGGGILANRQAGRGGRPLVSRRQASEPSEPYKCRPLAGGRHGATTDRRCPQADGRRAARPQAIRGRTGRSRQTARRCPQADGRRAARPQATRKRTAWSGPSEAHIRKPLTGGRRPGHTPAEGSQAEPTCPQKAHKRCRPTCAPCQPRPPAPPPRSATRCPWPRARRSACPA